jgi:membrane protease YdiL (CAAX protease family)
MASAARAPLLGVLAAIAVTTTMDACGLSAVSALPLLPLLILFAYLERLSRRSLGFIWGRPGHHALAASYPLAVLGVAALVALVAGAADPAAADWRKAGMNLALVAVSTFVAAILTEEGFFRGWLFASLARAGRSESAILLLSSLAFSLWHLSAVSLDTGFDLPAAQIPVYLANAALLGGVWGLLRAISGSVVVASVSHGLWNGGAYVLFGFGTRPGALGIEETAVYGPEVGLLGLALNGLFAAALWRWWKGHRGVAPPDA